MIDEVPERAGAGGSRAGGDPAADRRLQVHVLGQPRVTVDGEPVRLGARQVVIAVRLAFAEGQPVSPQRLLDDVWPDGSANDGALRVALTRLRSALGPDVVRRTGSGYQLAPSVGVDARRFDGLMVSARDRSRSLETRIAALEEALALWTGPACDGIERHRWVELEAMRLDEAREQAVDLLFELRLLTEDSETLLPELRQAYEEAPTREHRGVLLATALYRAGQQVDALEVLSRTRRRLRDDLGLDPSPSLDTLERRILDHDEQLRQSPATLRASIRAETESRLRAATALTRAGAYDEAFEIIDDATAASKRLGDRHSLAMCLLARARAVAFSGGGDPHPLIDEARTIARQLRDGPLLARCAIVRFSSGVPHDKTAALVELTEPLDLLPSSAPECVELLCAAAAIVTFIDNSEAAERLLALAEDLHRRQLTIRTETLLLTTRSIVGALRGAPFEDIDQWATQAHALATESGDPEMIVISIQALLRTKYALGDLDAVDAMLDQLEAASNDALLAFGVVRVSLCRTINAIARGRLDEVPELLEGTRRAGERFRTFVAETARLAQSLLLDLELDRRDQVRAAVRPFAEARPASVWTAVLAVCGDPGAVATLRELAPEVMRDDLHIAFVAFASRVAAESGDVDLGRWCAHELDRHGDHTVMVGLGTFVVGFAPYFAGLAHAATGDLAAAAVRLERALLLAEQSGVGLWRDQAAVELAEVLVRCGGPAGHDRANALLSSVAEGSVVVQSRRLARRLDAVSAAIA